MKTPFRITPAMLDLLEVLIATEEPVHGYRLARQARRPTGTVHPALGRLERAGWVTSEREVSNPVRGRPPRRLYEMTVEGNRLGREVLNERRPGRA